MTIYLPEPQTPTDDVLLKPLQISGFRFRAGDYEKGDLIWLEKLMIVSEGKLEKAPPILQALQIAMIAEMKEHLDVLKKRISSETFYFRPACEIPYVIEKFTFFQICAGFCSTQRINNLVTTFVTDPVSFLKEFEEIVIFYGFNKERKRTSVLLKDLLTKEQAAKEIQLGKEKRKKRIAEIERELKKLKLQESTAETLILD